MSVRDVSLRFYWKAQSVMVPGLQYAQTLYEHVLWQVTTGRGAWLELGCGHQVLPPWRSVQEVDLVKQTRVTVGLDADFHSLKSHRTIARRVCGSVTTLPFMSESFDLVSSNMVFEHLDDPEAFLRETAGHFDRIYIEVPDFDASILNRLRQLRGRKLIYQDSDHVSEFDRAELKALAVEAGLRITGEDYSLGFIRLWCTRS